MISACNWGLAHGGREQALERVFDASNEFEVLDLPVELTEDFTKIRK